MRIAIACGGTGGHIYPGLTLAQTLKQKRPSLDIAFLATGKPIDRALFAKTPYRVHYLMPCPMPEAASLKWIPFLCRFGIALCQALWFQATFRPNCLVAFGGYVSGPAILSGLLFGKRTLLHEENLVPGRANRLLASRVTRISLGFRESARFLRQDLPLVTTGPVVRAGLHRLERKAALDSFGLEEKRQTLLVMGGSQGSHRINTLFLEAIKLFPADLLRSLQVIHLTGQKDAAWVQKAYGDLRVPARVYPFLEAMGEAYSAAEVAVARGGAMTVAEIIFFRKPAVLIPLTLAQGHQRRNIQALADQGASILLTEEEATPSSLAKAMLDTLQDSALRESMRRALEAFETDVASERLAGEVLKLVNGVGKSDKRQATRDPKEEKTERLVLK